MKKKVQAPLNVDCKVNFRFEIEDFKPHIDPEFFTHYSKKWGSLMKAVKDHVKEKNDYRKLKSFRELLSRRKLAAEDIAGCIADTPRGHKEFVRLITDCLPVLDKADNELKAYVLVASGLSPEDIGE